MSNIVNYQIEKLIEVIQSLSISRGIEEIRDIVKHAARELVGSDGATFVLRDQDQCYYLDEDAISPLWKGKRFPIDVCISGWAMLNKQAVAIEDIYKDERVPHDAYRPTFVKSLVMVPIRTDNPIGAIGNYWKTHHQATPDEIKLLAALANSTSIAIENTKVYSELEERVDKRTAQLQAINQELEAFCYSVSHDLRAPLRHINQFSKMIREDKTNTISDVSLDYLKRIDNKTTHMNALVNDLLKLSRITRSELHINKVNLSELCEDMLKGLAESEPGRDVQWKVEKNLISKSDKNLTRIMLENLLSNAWKFTSKTKKAKIEVGKTMENDRPVYFIRDNGAGFNATQDNVFRPFQRFHTQEEFPGTGIGLATVHRIVNLHNGKIWVKSSEGKGATFYFYCNNDDKKLGPIDNWLC